MEKTLVILKPDAIKRKLMGEIISRLEGRNLNITHMEMVVISDGKARRLYGHVSHEPIYEPMIKYITSGPVLLLIVEGDSAISMVRKMIGSRKTYDSPPGTIRGDLGYHDFENLIHASDSVENAQLEIKLLLNNKI